MTSMNLKETELCLGLPGGRAEGDAKVTGGKRGFLETVVALKLNLEVVPNENINECVVDINKENILMMKSTNNHNHNVKDNAKPPAKAQVVGWPPVRSYLKNIICRKTTTTEVVEKSGGNNSSSGAVFVKVSMDGAPYLRKVDLKMYKTYQELSDALAKMFSSFTKGAFK